MVVSTPDKALLVMLWEAVKTNGRTHSVSFTELAEGVRSWQYAGVRVYATDSLDDLSAAVRSDARALAGLGFVEMTDDQEAVELTQAGQMVASTMNLPEWARHRLSSASVASAKT